MGERKPSWSRRFGWANFVLLTLALAQAGSGFFGLINGREDRPWLLWIHGIGAYGIVLTLAWKGGIVLESLRRRRGVSPALLSALLLLMILLSTLVTGLVWTFGGRILVMGFSFITLHVVLAMLALGILPWHVLDKRWIFRDKAATARRTFLRFGGLAAAGMAVWLLAEGAMDLFRLAGSRRRFTGSYETGSLTGEFPVVTWLFDFPQPVDVPSWRLTIDGAVERPLLFTYDQLAGMATDQQGSSLTARADGSRSKTGRV